MPSLSPMALYRRCVNQVLRGILTFSVGFLTVAPAVRAAISDPVVLPAPAASPAPTPPAAPTAPATPAAPAELATSPVENSVVKVFSTMRYPDLFKPWTKQAPREATGTGVVIEGKRILTNAHVVLY